MSLSHDTLRARMESALDSLPPQSRERTEIDVQVPIWALRDVLAREKHTELRFDVTGIPVEEALAIPMRARVFGHAKAVAWSTDENRMILYWIPTKDAHPLPAPMDAAGVAKFVEAWLSTVDYGPAPDTDGSTGKSCRIYNEQWGHIDGNHAAFVAIEPAWLVYGK